MKKLFFNKVIVPYLMKNPLPCSQVLRDAMVYQMVAANIPYSQINKWLEKVTGGKIVGTAQTEKGPTVFYEWPSQERQRELNVLGRVRQVV